MKKHVSLCLAYILSMWMCANDATFHMSGNHLIPIMETDISVKKEILTIKRISKDELKVDVYYEFYNLRQAKKTIVGFEAASPDRGKNGVAPQYDWHPYMSNFTVNMNGAKLPHKITLVADSVYMKNNEIVSLTKQQAIATESAETMSDDETRFNYVYYFDANFKVGYNTIRHTYNIKLTGGVIYHYAFYYILTAAMRWGNKQIDDFTLIVDMGDFEDFYINDSPFGDGVKWSLNGIGRIIEKAPRPWGDDYDDGVSKTHFLVKKGYVEYKALNFKPKGELFLYSPFVIYGDFDSFDYKIQKTLPYGFHEYGLQYEDAANAMSRRILRNYPFARRGYIFSTPEIQQYYSAQQWYIPDRNYKATVESLTNAEKAWVKKWSD